MAENWYIILELDFDENPVEDSNIINQRIEEKARFWASRFHDFNKGAQYRKYYQMIPEIKRIMLDETERKKQIEQAKIITYAPIDKILKTIGRKGMITAQEVARLSVKQKVSMELVKRRANILGIQVMDSKESNEKEIYEKYYKIKPPNAAAYEGMKPLLDFFHAENLYDFLFAKTSVRNPECLPYETLKQRAEEKKKKEFYKTDSISGTGSKLCAHCEVTFFDNSSKQAYDTYLQYKKRQTILNEIKEIYDISGAISTEQVNEFIGKLIELSKDKVQSEQLLSAFCTIEKIPIPVSQSNMTPNSNIKICRCGCRNDISDGRNLCKNCGLELVFTCPCCGKKNDITINVCSCGFLVEWIDKAEALCSLAQTEMEQMEFLFAKTHLDDANRYLPNSSKVIQLKMRLAQLEQRVGTEVEQMRNACEKREYFRAQKSYYHIKHLFPQWKEEELEKEIEDSISKAKQFIYQSYTVQKEEDILEFCWQAYQICKDYDKIAEVVSNYPPKAPNNLTVTADGKAKANQISWKTEETNDFISYMVRRKEDTTPQNNTDGQLVKVTKTCQITDTDIIPGKAYFYTVFAERMGVYSKPVSIKEPVFLLFEIENVSITPKAGEIQIQWREIPDDAQAVVYRRNDFGMEERLECENTCGYLDKGLYNEVRYTYRICLEYHLNKTVIQTPGVLVSGIPTRLPKIIEQIYVKPLPDNKFQVSWENRENSKIQFYYSTVRPEISTGDIILLTTLETKMNRLEVTPIRSEAEMGYETGIFEYIGTETIYVTAAVIQYESALIGAFTRAGRGETVVIKSVGIVNDKIHILIEPPERAVGFVVLYRFDQFPIDISDVNTIRKYIPLKQYQFHHALIIDSREPSYYYFSVFAEFIKDGEKEYSTATDYLFTRTRKQIITYSITVNKKLFGENSVIFEFESESQNFILPELCIALSIGAAPLYKDSAEIFAIVPTQQVNTSIKIKFPLPKRLERDVYLKAFLNDTKLQALYQLKLKLKSSYQIS